MKYVVLVPDGASDEPVDALGGRTPLEAAAMPNLAALAARGEVGRAATIPPGMPPGSDVGNMSILGYDPARFHTGRAPIEAAAMGVDVGDDEVAYRCNLVTVGDDGTMLDFSAGHIPTAVSRPIIEALDAALGGDGIRFHPGVMYRHVMVAPRALGDADCAPPHDLSDKPVVLPSGPAAPRLIDLMERSKEVVAEAAAGFGAVATQIWLWGQGSRPAMPAFRDRFGVEGALVTAVDLIRGLGVLTGLEVVEVEGATGYYDTNYEGKRDACLAALGDRDFFLLHVEASDEAGHNGDVEAKVESLQHWDRRIIGPLVESLDGLGPWRLLLLPDHPTPVALKTHTSDPVPYLLVDSAGGGPGGVYTESATAGCAPVVGHELMGRLIGL
jgi:2,3-bisphosphoglycerate-independent phosphoglycerate mutase